MIGGVRISLDLDDLRMRRGGAATGPVLLLLHGLGATGEVWDGLLPLLDDRWPGPWLAPDLPGHGGSRWLRSYSYGSVAAAVSTHLPADADLLVLGHSFGGAVGAVLASGWFGVRVRAVAALGVKVRWSADDVERARALAARPAAWYDTPDEAIARHLRVSGLAGLVSADQPGAQAGVVGQNGQWRLALDPAAFGVGPPDPAGLVAAARARLVWARGEHDDLVSEQDLRDLPAEPVQLAGLGHNAHVQDPDAAWALARGLLDAVR
jgi:pimeloyl-ACP methyl ester carboxylesterase